MAEIKNLQHEDGIIERFHLIYNGDEISIEKPEGWNEIDCILNINSEFFNVDDFILGASQKFKILEFNNKEAFNLINAAYETHGGDAKILFKWTAEKEGVIFDILKEGYQLNLNKYNSGFEKEKRFIELEIKKRDSNNKLLTREDVSVDLFSDKDLDDNNMADLEPLEFYYKEKRKVFKNFFFYSSAQLHESEKETSEHFFLFTKSEDSEFGDGTNKKAGYRFRFAGAEHINNSLQPIYEHDYMGNFLYTTPDLQKVSVEFSNFHVINKENQPFKILAIVKNGDNVIEEKTLLNSIGLNFENQNVQSIKIVNQDFEIGRVKSGETLDFVLRRTNGEDAKFSNIDNQASIEIKSEVSPPLKKSKMILLADVIDRLANIYTGGNITLKSDVLNNGVFKNSAVSTGLFLRAFSELYTSKSMKTSLKKVLYEGASPLMALGFDILENELRIEPIDYFFKDVQNYDFSDKPYLEEQTKISHDLDFSFNELVFGSKKHSKGRKGDLKNFNTKLKALTPIESAKKKFDKQTDFIIDDFKINKMFNEKSTASRTTDDDLILLDLIHKETGADNGVLTNCIHEVEGSSLKLTCYDVPFDTMPIKVGKYIFIESGLNEGAYIVQSIGGATAILDTLGSNVDNGTADTPIFYYYYDKMTNRTNEGFETTQGIDYIETSSNLRHNPKFQMYRWFGYFGGGLNKKDNLKEVKVTDYTNNGNVSLKVNPLFDELSNEIEELVLLGGNEQLKKLRKHKEGYFSGEKIEVTITGVTWFEFFQFYNSWRYDSNESRGYVKVNTPYGIKDVYIFGDNALSYDRENMELSIKGKLKRQDVEIPVSGELQYEQNIKSESVLCDYSSLKFTLTGNDNVNIKFTFSEEQTATKFIVRDDADSSYNLYEVLTPSNNPTEFEMNFTLNGTRSIIITINVGQSSEYSCDNQTNILHPLYAKCEMTITGSNTTVEEKLECSVRKWIQY